MTAVAGVELHETDRQAPAPVEQLDPTTALARAPLAQSLGRAGLAQLMGGSRIQDVAAGTAIVNLGERDDTYHVLLSGSARVVVGGTVRQELFPGDGFGEIAVLHRIARSASVIASDRSVILTIDGETVRGAVRDHGGDALAALSG